MTGKEVMNLIQKLEAEGMTAEKSNLIKRGYLCAKVGRDSKGKGIL